MDHGVPWDVAFGVNDNLRQALNIIFGQLEGGVFNFNSMRWEERK